MSQNVCAALGLCDGEASVAAKGATRWITVDTPITIHDRHSARSLLMMSRSSAAGGKVEPATIAHHIEPHRGDINAFRSGALQSLCKRCHDELTESGKPKRAVGLDGFPVDPGK